MVQDSNGSKKSQPDEKTKGSGRGRTKNFPLVSLPDALVLAKAIRQHAPGSQIRRLTVFEKLGRSPDSSSSRELITNSNRYGLTTGSYNAEFLTLTDFGRLMTDNHLPAQQLRKSAFEAAIGKFEPFVRLYETLKNKRVPDADVLSDEIGQLGVDRDDRQRAAEVFLKNARYLGLVKDMSGTERIVPIDHVLEGLSSGSALVQETVPLSDLAYSAGTSESAQDTVDTSSKTAQLPGLSRPSLHIDVQIHIDSSASLEQIDQIFSSMARHLYGSNGN